MWRVEWSEEAAGDDDSWARELEMVVVSGQVLSNKVELISCRISCGLRGRACEQRQGAAGSMDVLFTEMGKVLGKVLGGASLRVTLGVLFRT